MKAFLLALTRLLHRAEFVDQSDRLRTSESQRRAAEMERDTYLAQRNAAIAQNQELRDNFNQACGTIDRLADEVEALKAALNPATRPPRTNAELFANQRWSAQ